MAKKKQQQSQSECDRVLVTGGAGFIASHIVRLLLRKGFAVRATVLGQTNNSAQPLGPEESFLRSEAVVQSKEEDQRLEIVSASLTDEGCWPSVVKGCRYVIHVASPVPNVVPKTQDEIVGPAVSGVKYVLAACANDGQVERVVFTSSNNAVGEASQPGAEPFTEKDFTDPDSIQERGGAVAYLKSKAVAEKAAWAFMKNELPKGCRMQLSVINPCHVLGPVLAKHHQSSPLVVQKMLQRDLPAVPSIWWNVVDVRDVAEAHVQAMIQREAAGERFVLNAGGLWYLDMCKIIAAKFNSMGYKVPTMHLPGFILWLASFVDPNAAVGLRLLNTKRQYDGSKASRLLGIKYHSVEESIISCAHSLVQVGAANRTEGYVAEEQ